VINKIILVILIFTSTLSSQILRKNSFILGEAPVEKLLGNSITDILVDGNAIWFATGNGLSKTTNNGGSWQSYNNKHGLGRGGVSAITKWNNIIFVATAYDTTIKDEENKSLPVGSGLSYSTDSGLNWTYIPQPYYKTPIQGLSYDIAVIDSTVWMASFGQSLQVSPEFSSPDFNNSKKWRTVVPDEFAWDPSNNLRHRVFSVISVGDSVLWVGSAQGISRSNDKGKTWKQFEHKNQPNQISGNFVVALAHQKYKNKSIIWSATWTAKDETKTEYYAVSYSDDEGNTWKTTLHDEFVHNFFVKDSVIYAVSDRGVFGSTDFGASWSIRYSHSQIVDKFNGERIYSPEFYSVAVANDKALWLGSSDGLARTADAGKTWEIFRSFISTNSKDSPQTYSYPNPFSPTRHYVSRFQYHTTKQTNVTIKIYDFSMDIVKTVVQNKLRAVAGDYSEAWDGTDNSGRMVANGVYFYKIEKEGKTIWGKIVVLN
jgi:hypothetical protein